MSTRSLECPVCLEQMQAPIFQCQTGHSMCNSCSGQIAASPCPICRKPMTKTRNWMLEDIIGEMRAAARALEAQMEAARAASARSPETRSARPPARTEPPAARVSIPCPFHVASCAYVFNTTQALEEHVRECIFRDMRCPYGAAFDNCFWIGKLKQMMEHFKKEHPANCILVPGAELEVGGVRADRSLRNVYLAAQGNMHFIVTMSVDPSARVAVWAVQHIGNKKNAQQYTYEIHVISKQESVRRAVFIERCFNDSLRAEEIFDGGKCATLPLRVLPHFLRDEKLTFRFTVKKVPQTPVSSISNLQLN